MTESVSTEVATLDAVAPSTLDRTIGGLNGLQGTSGNGFFTTIQGADRETKIKTLAAMTDSVPLKDNKNKVLWIEDIIIQAVELTDDKTGEISIAPRVTLIDQDGTAYHATSGGTLKSVENIVGIMGANKEAWGGPLPLKMKEEKARVGTYYTLVVDLKALSTKK